MVWAEVPTTPDELEMEATKSLDLKPFSHFLCFPSSVSLDSLQSPETPFTANIMMGSPETLLSPLAPYYASFSEEVKRLSNSDTKEGSVELQNGEILQVATTTNFKPVNESDKIEESVTNSIQDDFSSRISSVTAFSPSEKTLEKRTINGEFSANNNKNNNTIVPNETPSKPKEMVYEKRYFPNNNQTSCYQKDLSIGRNLNLLNYSQIRNRNCTNILNSKDFHDNLILPQTPKEENSSNTRSNIHKNNMCNKKSTFTATVSKSQSPNRYKEDALNPFVNKGFGLDWEDGKRYQHQKLAKNFKRIGRTKSIIRKTETQDISKTRPLSKEDNIDSSEISDKHHNGARRMKKKENIKHSPNDFIFERLAVAKETKESDSINKADIKRSLLSNPKTILAKPPAETVKEETKLNSEVLKIQKDSDNRNGKNLHTATKQGSGATLHQVAAKRKPTKMRGKGGANEIKGLLTSCSVPNGIWDDKGIPWNKKREKARIRDLRAKLESFDPGFEIEKPSTDQPLGPKFFAQLCNVWPDLIARLALDINLEATSPDTPPDPPDPPNEASCAGLPYWSSSKHEINKTTSEGTTVLENKCCSSEDPSCPQLPLESIVPDTFESSKRVSLQQELSGGLKASPRREDLKKKQHILPEELEAESPSRKRHTVAIQESPRLSRKSPFDSFEMKRSSSCQSPICGSPRPKAPCPIAEISELESLESEGPDEDEEIIISTISRGGDYEEDEDLGDEGDEEEEEDEEEEDGEEGEEEEEEEQVSPEEVDDNQEGPMSKSQNERMRRRLLPEIPKNKKSFSSASILALRTPTLAEEIQEAESGVGSRSSTPEGFSLMSSHSRPILVLKCHSYIRDDTSSPETDLRLPSQDIDSGHSTQHSPDGAKSMSPQAVREISPLSPGLGVALSQLEMLDATHRGLYRFIPRHSDEVEIEIGDPIYVQKEADDLWCEGVNLRSGMQGIFPAAHVTDVDYSEFDPTVSKVKKERYLLNYLGSIETLCHKGNQVLCQAVRKIAREDGGRSSNPTSCILEVSDQGIRMVDKSRPGQHEGTLGHDYFYHLKHVSFCGFHPKDPRYFGFITKHPAVQRFACHVFESVDSTRPVAEAVGRAFHRFYKKFIETAYPTEDIYIE